MHKLLPLLNIPSFNLINIIGFIEFNNTTIVLQLVYNCIYDRICICFRFLNDFSFYNRNVSLLYKRVHFHIHIYIYINRFVFNALRGLELRREQLPPLALKTIKANKEQEAARIEPECKRLVPQTGTGKKKRIDSRWIKTLD